SHHEGHGAAIDGKMLVMLLCCDASHWESVHGLTVCAQLALWNECVRIAMGRIVDEDIGGAKNSLRPVKQLGDNGRVGQVHFPGFNLAPTRSDCTHNFV